MQSVIIKNNKGEVKIIKKKNKYKNAFFQTKSIFYILKEPIML